MGGHEQNKDIWLLLLFTIELTVIQESILNKYIIQ